MTVWFLGKNTEPPIPMRKYGIGLIGLTLCACACTTTHAIPKECTTIPGNEFIDYSACFIKLENILKKAPRTSSWIHKAGDFGKQLDHFSKRIKKLEKSAKTQPDQTRELIEKVLPWLKNAVAVQSERERKDFKDLLLQVRAMNTKLQEAVKKFQHDTKQPFFKQTSLLPRMADAAATFVNFYAALGNEATELFQHFDQQMHGKCLQKELKILSLLEEKASHVKPAPRWWEFWKK